MKTLISPLISCIYCIRYSRCVDFIYILSDLLHELFDVDEAEEEDEEEGAHSGIQVLVEALIENQGLELLVQVCPSSPSRRLSYSILLEFIAI